MISRIMQKYQLFFAVKVMVMSFTLLVRHVCSADWRYEVCEPQSCSSGPNISFPFWITNGGSGGTQKSDFCGYKGFEVICKEDKPIFQTPNNDFIIQNISYSDKSLRLINTELSVTTCLAPRHNFSSDTFTHKSDSSSDDYFLYLIPSQVTDFYFFYNCTKPSGTNFTLSCAANATGPNSFAILDPDSWYVNDTAKICSSYVWQTVDWDPSEINNYTKLLMNGLTARWSEPANTPCPGCEQSGGRCGVGQYNDIVCFCPDGVHSTNCTSAGKRAKPAKETAYSVVGGVLFLMLLACCCAAKGSPTQFFVISGSIMFMLFSLLAKTIYMVLSLSVKSIPYIYSCQVHFWKKIGEIFGGIFGMITSGVCSYRFNIWKKTDSKKIDEFLRKNNCGLPRYSYSDIKKITNSFAVKLGEGGFGDVYEGKLLDGTAVAVKVLNTSKSNDKDFLNELISVSKTSHVNIVSLLGFCSEGSKRILIFEFMSKGSLEKYILGNSTVGKLEWNVIFRISIGIAKGLEYLHSGCNARIFHFDIKPQNILLDEDFTPKISDFGLAKLCPRRESVIAISNPAGTPGYVAPEVCNYNGEVSHKSDIYSYGMMLLEMVVGRGNAARVRPANFTKWIYRRIERGEELGLGDMVEEERNCAKKMIIAGLWCIQREPSERPRISEVVSMLEGSVESLQMPPKPYLSSPTVSVETVVS